MSEIPAIARQDIEAHLGAEDAGALVDLWNGASSVTDQAAQQIHAQIKRLAPYRHLSTGQKVACYELMNGAIEAMNRVLTLVDAFLGKGMVAYPVSMARLLLPLHEAVVTLNARLPAADSIAITPTIDMIAAGASAARKTIEH